MRPLKPGDPALAVDIDGTTVKGASLVDRELIVRVGGGRGAVCNLEGVPIEVDDFETFTYTILVKEGKRQASMAQSIHRVLTLWMERQEPLRFLAAPGDNSALVDRYGLTIELPECAEVLSAAFNEADL